MQGDLFFPHEVHRQVIDGTLPPELIAETREVMHEVFGRPSRGEDEAVRVICLLLALIELNWPRGSLEYALGQFACVRPPVSGPQEEGVTRNLGLTLEEWATACAPLVVHSESQKTKPDGETSGSDGSV